MIDDFEAVLPPADEAAREGQELARRPVPPDPDDPDTWTSEFRAYLDDPE